MIRKVIFTMLIAALGGCRTTPLQDAVNNELAADNGFVEAVRAAEAAQRAYHYLADSPIEEIRANPKEAADWITSARDAWRAAQTYRINEGETQIKTEFPIRPPEDIGPHTVDIFAKSVRVRVVAYRSSFVLAAIVSERGRDVIQIKVGGQLEAEQDFRPFLVGDKVDIDSILVKIRRGEALGD